MAGDSFTGRAYNFYLGQGWKPHQAAALAGNAHWESGGNPTITHDQGTGLGLFGWRDPEPGKGRKTDLINWAKTAGPNGAPLDPYDELTQLKYSQHELTKGGEKAAGDALANSTDLRGAQNATMSYLRPQGYTPDNPAAGHGYANRYNNAAALTGDAPMPVPSGSGGGGGGSNVVMTAGPSLPPPPAPLPATSPNTGLLAAAAAAAQQQREEDQQQTKYAALEKEGMGLLGQGTTPAPTFGGGGGGGGVHVPKAVPMPDFVQMLAQQRLMRGV